ncbi:MAG: hydrogenase maturation protease [Chloroflexota bacterium]|nr:hydrogenase maturation protease [Chloroflexota bacterium]
MKKTLVIGFGNVYRQDDGVGFVVVNALREKLGRSPLGVEDDGFDDLGHELDTLILHQLVPDLADMVAGYDLVVFLDAHVGTIPDPIREEEVVACYRVGVVSHQLYPCTVLALAHDIYDRQPRGVLLSIRGHDFDFGEGLSAQTEALVPEAVIRVLALAADGE